MRRWPRGKRKSICDLWLPSLGPSQSLLKEYRAGGVSWEEFAIWYREDTLAHAKEDMNTLLKAEQQHGGSPFSVGKGQINKEDSSATGWCSKVCWRRQKEAQHIGGV